MGDGFSPLLIFELWLIYGYFEYYLEYVSPLPRKRPLERLDLRKKLVFVSQCVFFVDV